MNRLFLSRRNLQTLINKLNAVKAGEHSFCTLIKQQNPDDPPEYQQTLDRIAVTAVEDEDYYRRPAGEVWPSHDPGQNGATLNGSDQDHEDFSGGSRQ